MYIILNILTHEAHGPFATRVEVDTAMWKLGTYGLAALPLIPSEIDHDPGYDLGPMDRPTT